MSAQDMINRLKIASVLRLIKYTKDEYTNELKIYVENSVFPGSNVI